MSEKIKISEKAYIAMTNKIASEEAYKVLNNIMPNSDTQEERDLIYNARMAILKLKALYGLSVKIEGDVE